MDKLQKALTSAKNKEENVIFIEAFKRKGYTFENWETLCEFINEKARADKEGNVTTFLIDGKPFLKKTVTTATSDQEKSVSLSTRVTYEFIK